MKKYKYIGDCEGMKLWGYDFDIDKVVEVTDPHALGKLANNSCFTEVKTRKKKVVSDGDSSGNTE